MEILVSVVAVLDLVVVWLVVRMVELPMDRDKVLVCLEVDDMEDMKD